MKKDFLHACNVELKNIPGLPAEYRTIALRNLDLIFGDIWLLVYLTLKEKAP